MQHLSGRWMKALNGIVIALSLALPGAAQAQSLESLVNVQGVRENQLVGYSLVVGLDGTGDKNQVKFTNQTITNMLRQFGVQLPSKIDPKVKNVAAGGGGGGGGRSARRCRPCTRVGRPLTSRFRRLAMPKACVAVHYCSPNYTALTERFTPLRKGVWWSAG